MVGEFTRAYRRRLGITQEELAERTGLSARAIRAIETGRSGTPRAATVRLLARAFGLSGAERDRYFEIALAASPPDPRPVPGPLPAPRERTVSGSSPHAVPAGAPRQLPRAVPGFAGRAEYLDRLNALLDAGTPATVVISGTAGVGKTTLAVHWAQHVAHHFPDGQLFVNLRGFGPPEAVVSPGEAVRGFLQALEVPTQRVPEDLSGQSALLRSLLAERRMLLVVDNARDSEHVRPLIPGAAGCLMLVTSRRTLVSLVAAEGAFPLALDLPTVDEAWSLMAGRLGPRRMADEPDAVSALIERCARLPLAMAVVAARAAIRPSLPLATFVDQLRAPDSHLDALQGGDEVSDVRTVFSWSYHQLGTQAARLFRLLGLHPGPDIGVLAVASLAGCGIGTAQAVLTELADSGLIGETAPDRYVLHDLMRSYAGELTVRIDTASARLATLHRALDHYLRTSVAADKLLSPHREPLPVPEAASGAVHVDLVDHHDAMAWFAAETAVLLAMTRLAADSGFDTHAWQLASSMHTYLYRQGNWHEAVAVHRTALQAAQRLDEDLAQAHSHDRLGRALIDTNGFDEARHHLEQAYARYGDLGDVSGAARIQQIIAVSFERQGDPARALTHLRLAVDLAESAGDTFLQGRFLNGTGWIYAHLGDHAEARAYCEQALLLMEKIDDRDGAADAWDSIGFALHHLGHHVEAVECYQRALELYRGLGHRFYLAQTLIHLGETHQAVGRIEPARAAWQDALDILTDLRHPDGDRVQRLLDGSQSGG